MRLLLVDRREQPRRRVGRLRACRGTGSRPGAARNGTSRSTCAAPRGRGRSAGCGSATRSSRENGGSRSTLCTANSTAVAQRLVDAVAAGLAARRSCAAGSAARRRRWLPGSSRRGRRRSPARRCRWRTPGRGRGWAAAPRLLGQQHRERIGLLAGRAAGHPGADRLVARPALETARQDLALERLERAAVAEEVGHADQQVLAAAAFGLVGCAGEEVAGTPSRSGRPLTCRRRSIRRSTVARL